LHANGLDRDKPRIYLGILHKQAPEVWRAACSSQSSMLRALLPISSLMLLVACEVAAPPPDRSAPPEPAPRAELRPLEPEQAPAGRARVAADCDGCRLFATTPDGAALFGRPLARPGHAAPEYALEELPARGSLPRSASPEPVTDALVLAGGTLATIVGGELRVGDRTIDTEVLPGLSATADGRRIFYARGTAPETEIHRADLDGAAAPVALTADGASAYLPAVSPDASRVAYVSTVTGLPSIWLMAPDGSGKRQLTNRGLAGDRAEEVARARPAPDGGSPPLWQAGKLAYFDGTSVRAVSAESGAELWWVEGGRAVFAAGDAIAVELSGGTLARVHGVSAR
jgi:hypothetical protein